MARLRIAKLKRLGIPVGGAVIASMVGVLLAKDHRAAPGGSGPEQSAADTFAFASTSESDASGGKAAAVTASSPALAGLGSAPSDVVTASPTVVVAGGGGGGYVASSSPLIVPSVLSPVTAPTNTVTFAATSGISRSDATSPVTVGSATDPVADALVFATNATVNAQNAIVNVASQGSVTVNYGGHTVFSGSKGKVTSH